MRHWLHAGRAEGHCEQVAAAAGWPVGCRMSAGSSRPQGSRTLLSKAPSCATPPHTILVPAYKPERTGAQRGKLRSRRADLIMTGCMQQAADLPQSTSRSPKVKLGGLSPLLRAARGGCSQDAALCSGLQRNTACRSCPASECVPPVWRNDLHVCVFKSLLGIRHQDATGARTPAQRPAHL